MFDPLAETVRMALETQQAELATTLEEVRDVALRGVPLIPRQQWRGMTRDRYEDDVLTLQETLYRAASAVQEAHELTGRALATLAHRGN